MNNNKDITVRPNSIPINPAINMNADVARRVAEVQGEILVAQQIPRNTNYSLQEILNECQSNKTLAKQAIYMYPRGGQTVQGPSIRLAEVVARHWGHMNMGIVEISQKNGETEMEAYAWDKQTNTRDTKRFFVKHERHSRNGVKKLDDPRDIYEIGANMGARRKRACIIAVIPGYIFDEAMNACREKMASNMPSIKEACTKLLKLFKDKCNVDVKKIEEKLGHSIDAISRDEMIELSNIFNSLKDGMSKRDDWFNYKAKDVSSEDKKTFDDLVKK